jgi:hypothetical protein
MAAATTTAGGVPNNVLGTFLGSSLLNAFPQVTPNGVASQNLDMLQITVPGTEPGSPNSPSPIVALNVDSNGVVHNPAVNPTNGTRLGVYHAGDRTTSSSTAQLFASAWRWNSSVGQGAQADIFQIVNLGGNISYWLDYLGVAHGS